MLLCLSRTGCTYEVFPDLQSDVGIRKNDKMASI